MKIIIDDKIPYTHGVFEAVAEVHYLPAKWINAESVKDADALMIRTRTICNASLLAGSSVKCIATATIGYDHIDTAYCELAGITWFNAPVCNSSSVEQYVLAAILQVFKTSAIPLHQLTIGVVGVGNVGKKVANVCRLLGMNVLLNDPPREEKEGKGEFVTLTSLMQEADIISLHAPLCNDGKYPTFHLCDELFFNGLAKQPVLINAARGEIVSTNAVKKAIQNKQISYFVCDCWENEPEIDLELLALTTLATPHIAGYSRDSKANGTTMSVQAISKFFSLGLDNWKAEVQEPPAAPDLFLSTANQTEKEMLTEAILHSYAIENDHLYLTKNSHLFEKYRDDYPLRREYPAFTLHLKSVRPSFYKLLQSLGFQVQNTI